MVRLMGVFLNINQINDEAHPRAGVPDTRQLIHTPGENKKSMRGHSVGVRHGARHASWQAHWYRSWLWVDATAAPWTSSGRHSRPVDASWTARGHLIAVSWPPHGHLTAARTHKAGQRHQGRSGRSAQATAATERQSDGGSERETARLHLPPRWGYASLTTSAARAKTLLNLLLLLSASFAASSRSAPPRSAAAASSTFTAPSEE